MMVTDIHVATLQAMLTGQEEEYGRHVAELERSGQNAGLVDLLGAVFHDVVLRRFYQGSAWRPAEVAGYVASLRSQWLRDGEADFDPNTAERLIRADLGDGEPPPLNTETLRTLGILVTGLVLDEELDEDGIATVLARARARANVQTG